MKDNIPETSEITVPCSKKLGGTLDKCSPAVKNNLISCLLHANYGANTLGPWASKRGTQSLPWFWNLAI